MCTQYINTYAHTCKIEKVHGDWTNDYQTYLQESF